MANEPTPNWNGEIIRELREIRNSITGLESKITDVKQSLQDEIHSIRTEMIEFQVRAQQLDEVSEWATRFKEKITLSDIERLREDVQNLREYKAKSTVVFATVQFVMAAVVAWLTKG